jgi:subtilisin-like proprotein convertase family protein
MAEWKGASGISTIAADKVQRKSDTQLVITIPPPAKGDAVLTLITPAGSKVSTKVTVL